MLGRSIAADTDPEFKSFVGGIVAYRVLPRPSFSTLQSGIFPVYFAMQTVLPAALALTFPGTSVVSGSPERSLRGLMLEQNRWSALVPIGTVFFAGLANFAFVGPAATKAMRERKHQETRDGKKSYDPAPHSKEMQRLNKKFGQLHGISTLINLAALLATIWYGGTLAEMLR